MPKYVLALGSSHHYGEHYINRAVDQIIDAQMITVQSKSRVYKNSASMTTYNSAFYNCALAVETSLHPRILYRELFALEYRLGRIRTYMNARRSIDIDVLMSLDFTYKSFNFHLPHGQALNRIFFVLPAIEALKLACWPLPIFLVQARAKFGRELLWPL
jgi:2-amino-4-hydroxy-6-hydroxymethyldihydropteridine diphosphokinase